ncbi:hypothetical protein [Rhodanobacter caeni]|uniref:hypothetical protein n=1 Tax=Rhodanobacter caeni TaxID=657654 RepID=UPI0031E19983
MLILIAMVSLLCMGDVPPAWRRIAALVFGCALCGEMPGPARGRTGWCGYFPRPATFLAALLRAVVALGLLLAVDLLAALGAAFLLADFAAFAGAAFLAVCLLLAFAVFLIGGLPATFLATAAFFATLAGVFFAAVFTMYGTAGLVAAFLAAGLAAALGLAAGLLAAFLAAAFAGLAGLAGVAFGEALPAAFRGAALRVAAGGLPMDSTVGSTGRISGVGRSSRGDNSLLLVGVSRSVGMPYSPSMMERTCARRAGARAWSGS